MRFWKPLFGVCSVLLVAVGIGSWFSATASSINNQDPACLAFCDQSYASCVDQYRTDCEALYAGNQAQISACKEAQQKICLEEYKACKLQCKYGECVPGDPPPCPPE